MAAEEEQECPPCPAGLPAYMGTFADLMSLLMCFFVLLLSFSEMDALKFKRLAGELREAFGVQTSINADDPPKGTSIIARSFSPAIPEPTPINEVRQKTSDITKSSLEVMCQDEVIQQEEKQSNQGEQSRSVAEPQPQAENTETNTQSESNPNKATEPQAEDHTAMQVSQLLQDEIAQGQIEVETVGMKIIIRIQQKGVFASGSDYIEDRFLPVIDKIREVLVNIPGRISVEGHTDDIPVSSGRFRSNWALSSARAVSFAEELFVAPELDEKRFQVVGHGSVQPLVPNTDAESRARNRRVEIVIIRSREGDNDNQPEIETDQNKINNAVNSRPEDFELRPNEIF
ncbi:flagellar motor protein MotB [Parathalassolituus penaei]|uniref:Flagellar motor protein MotB n=1 Tax=Parathalassolituus penaei TaxID=2997323 RepID=A0A9X3ITS6_9GAMM|nr:flagellar motor protein MotB [Parathalassolituus penaei]MCY0967206.1 flagellar motor protein MotB [Parathalassolituus penaei]